NISWSTAVVCCRATSCSRTCGGIATPVARARSTFTSGVFAKSCRSLPPRSSPCSRSGTSFSTRQPRPSDGRWLSASGRRRSAMLIAADGKVVGDSAETLEAVAGMENHGTRPEVIEARQAGIGRARRHSDTLGIDMLYVAVPVRHPSVAFARVARPLTDIRQELRAIVETTLFALAVAFAGAAVLA